MPQSYAILSTPDPGIFKTVEGNRELSWAHVRKLKDAILADPDSIRYNPILTNEKLEVIDGQHRKQAIIEANREKPELDLNFYYISVPNLGIKEVQKLNSNSKMWQPVDYAAAFSRLGVRDYDYYLMFRAPQGKKAVYKDLALNHDSLMRYLALDNPITSISFADGKLKVDDFDRSLELLRQRKELEEVTQYQRAGVRAFALAFLRIATHPDYNHKRMLDRAQSQAWNKFIRDFSQERDYAKALNQVYNYDKEKKIALVDSTYLLGE